MWRVIIMKKIVIYIGRNLIDFSACITFITLLIYSIVTMLRNFELGFKILLIGLIIFTFLYYFLYLIISINDNLTEINSKLMAQISINDNCEQPTLTKTEETEDAEVIEVKQEKTLAEKDIKFWNTCTIIFIIILILIPVIGIFYALNN